MLCNAWLKCWIVLHRVNYRPKVTDLLVKLYQEWVEIGRYDQLAESLYLHSDSIRELVSEIEDINYSM